MRHIKTGIVIPGIRVSDPEIEVNLLQTGAGLTVPPQHPDCEWDFSMSISTDRAQGETQPHDELTCYINATLHQKGITLFIVKLNTLHTYKVSALTYKKAHTQLFMEIARESVQHANALLAKKVKGTAREGIFIPLLDEDFLEDDAREWNRRGYIPQPVAPTAHTPGRKLSKQELDELSQRISILVRWIDAADEAGGPQTEEEKIEYYTKYAEWVKLNNLVWHFKLIGLNQIACLSTRMMEKLEKAMREQPDDEVLRETYHEMKDNYLKMMNELKAEFAKN